MNDDESDWSVSIDSDENYTPSPEINSWAIEKNWTESREKR